MQKRIYLNFIGLIFLSVLLLAISFGVLFFQAVRNQEIAAIQSKTNLIADLLNQGSHSVQGDFVIDSDSRITIIAPDGHVLIDSHTDAEVLDLRYDRTEFQEALLYGKGESVRYSTVFDSETYYYAIRLQDGNVLRISRTLNSLGVVFISILPALFAITILVFMLAHILARRLTRNIIKPLGEIDFEQLDDTASNDFYEELLPYIKKINRQKQEITQQITKQQKAETQRREFSANVSHELKTPLTTISALSEMMANGMAKPEDITGFAEKISGQSKRLIAIIDDIIRLSEFDEHKVEREYVSFDVFELAKSVIDALEEKAREKKISITLTGGAVQLIANPRLVDELLFNLVENGIKYNKEGGQLIVEVLSEAGFCKLSVADTGIGISEEQQKRVFERFYRADSSRTRKTGGTGLGLSIVKHIVEHHNGKLTMESAEGEGTTIVCWLPSSEKE